VAGKARRKVLNELFDVLLASAAFMRKKKKQEDQKGAEEEQEGEEGTANDKAISKHGNKDKNKSIEPIVVTVLDASNHAELTKMIQPVELAQAMGDVLSGLKHLVVSREQFVAATETYLDSISKTQALIEKGYPRIAALVVNRATGRGPASYNELGKPRRLAPTEAELEYELHSREKPVLTGPAARRDRMAQRHYERTIGAQAAEGAKHDRPQLLGEYNAHYHKKSAAFKETYEKERFGQCTFKPIFFTKAGSEEPGLEKAAAKLKRLQQQRKRTSLVM
jgi:hypothetical protein